MFKFLIGLGVGFIAASPDYSFQMVHDRLVTTVSMLAERSEPLKQQGELWFKRSQALIREG